MALQRGARLAAIALLVVVAGYLLAELGVLPAPWTEDRATVEIVGDGETKAVVEAEVADTERERHTGLSNHASLAAGEGMLFVHGSAGQRTYVMRGMDFDIDIVFVDADGEITAIRHARAPGPGEDGEQLRYSGWAKWVLEVPRGYANETGLEVGDEVRIEYD